ncbi:hypothetical protein P9VFCI_197 [Rhizobium phage P9VFCI]|uniref:Baseplate wedge subunit n=1 Tax=Rhizobium phage P9VFCI TaxID=2763531 RepID=A0A7G7WX36_9CAUD|nr:baseplate wedge subunit [Rhizobium phage P9VFCI]QNH71780.1 hypothetical protein P9VFCI_197 [Rhizobium phage P9VFCI]
MTARINLTLSKDETGFHIDGNRSFDFQAGVEYVLSSDENVWVTWKDNTTSLTKFDTPTKVLNLNNLTCVDHHRYAADSLLYYVQAKKIVDLQGIPIGLWNKEIEDVISEYALEDDIQKYISSIILPQRRFNTNGTFEELFNLEQEDYELPEEVIYPTNDSAEREYSFERSERYLAIVSNGERVPSDLYRAFFVKNGDFNRVKLFENHSFPLYVRSDLCHNVRNNGTKTITVRVREGDERKFFFNSFDTSYKTSFVGRGINSPENIVTIRNQFDDYIISNYPQIYEFVKSYYDYENLATSPSSFFRNMSDYYDVDKMPEALLRDKIKKVFPFVDSVQVDKRLFAKRVIDFFKNKGNKNSFAWLSNAFFKKTSGIHRYSDDLIRLSMSPVTTYLVVNIHYTDLQRIIVAGDAKKLGVDSGMIDDLADALVGNVFQGRSSGSTALIEKYEKIWIQKQAFYKFYCSAKNSEFEDGELLDIRRIDGNININRYTSEMTKKGIVGVEIVDGAFGYSYGQVIQAETLTGEGFKAEVVDVDKNGAIKNVKVLDSGWYYRPVTDTVFVDNDFRRDKISFDASQISFASLVRSSGYRWTFLDGDVVETKIVKTDLSIDDKYNLNRNQYVFNNPIASSRLNNSVLFFAKGLDSRSVYAIDQFDKATKINVKFTSDIVNLYATERSLIVVTNNGLSTMAIADVLKKYPTVKETIIQSSAGFVRTIFIVNNRLFGFTANNIVELDAEGDVTNSWSVNRIYDFAAFKVNEKVSTLYLGSGSNLYAYQWFDGETKAVLKPVFGNFYKVFEEDESSKNKLSGSSVFSDNSLYQDFSFGIELDETTDKYMNEYKKLVNPSGYKVTGVHRDEIASSDELQLEVVLDQGQINLV